MLLPHYLCMRPYFINIAQDKLLQFAHLHDHIWNSVPVCYLQELSEEIEDYTQRFNTEDQLEWNLVLQEVAAFVEVTNPSNVT